MTVYELSDALHISIQEAQRIMNDAAHEPIYGMNRMRIGKAEAMERET